ncbi:hypothetical protein ALI144C_34490 [Actinosynnema sp. ALI-1.44]|nr:hypothetical protein ALI144C_34490 [Actinosynnema sp. ALI-1.44]
MNKLCDAFVVDPSGRAPILGPEEFQKDLQDMVNDEAPRIFAVVQEYGDRVDGQIAAWGMAFDDGVDVFSLDQGTRIHVRNAENAVHFFNFGTWIRAHLIWVKPQH